MQFAQMTTMLGFYVLVLLVFASILILYLFSRLWVHMFAVFAGVLTAYLDFRGDDPQFAVLLLFAFGLFIGFSSPRHAWRCALLLGVWIPIVQIGRIVAGGMFDLFLREGAFSLMALLPAFVGVYTGAAFQRRSGAGRSS